MTILYTHCGERIRHLSDRLGANVCCTAHLSKPFRPAQRNKPRHLDEVTGPVF